MKIQRRISDFLIGAEPRPPRRRGRVGGKTAIVTGAGRGLGKAISQALAREGAKVLLTDIDESLAAAAAASIGGHEGNANHLEHDVADEDQWAQVVSKAEALFGRLDILVNNAGIGIPTDIDNFNSDDVRQTFSVNVDGTLFGIAAAIPVMNKSGGGSIINVSSVGGIVALPGMAAYCASKGAVRLLTKSIAIECANKNYAIRVNSIHPGFVPTQQVIDDIKSITGQSTEEAIAGITATIPMGRPGTPEDIANGVLFLASDESGFMTGSELVMDGGVTAA